MMRRAFRKANLTRPLVRCETGDDALDYLSARGRWTAALRPCLIVLDLNLPGIDGREVLSTVKADPALRSIPIVVLTTSNAAADIDRCYGYGANTYVCKPAGLDAFVAMVRQLTDYWSAVAVLPSPVGI